MNQQFQCTKIKDGLYIGNIVAAHDYQFLISNKFGFVVNCTSQIPNVFQHQNNIKYLKFKLVQNKTHKLWDQTLKKLNKLQKFLQQAEQHSLCCLIHSFHGHNRNLVFVIGYLMKKYQWRLKKCIAFIKSKQVFVNLSNHYISQLQILQQILTKQSILSLAWTPPYINSQQQILSKTYLNSLQCTQSTLVALKNQQSSKKKSQKRVVWLDRYQKKKAKQQYQLLRKQKQKTLQKQKQKQKQKISLLKQKQKQPTRLSKQKHKKKSKQSQNFKHKPSTHIETQKVKNYSINFQSLKNGKKDAFNNNKFVQFEEKEKQGSTKKNKRKYNLKQQDEQQEDEGNQRQNYQSYNDSSNNRSQKEEKNIYQLTINNFISPNFNIINKTDNLIQKKSKKQQKQSTHKLSNKTSQAQSIKFLKQQKSKNKQKNKDKTNNNKKSIQKIKRAQSQKQVTNIRQFKQLKDLILKDQYLNNNNYKDNNNSSNKKQKQQVLNSNKDISQNKDKKSLNGHNKLKDKDIRKQLKKQIEKVQKEKSSYSTNSLHLIYPITNLAQNLIKNQQNQQKRSVTPTRKQRKK